jgi:hypothetical protein
MVLIVVGLQEGLDSIDNGYIQGCAAGLLLIELTNSCWEPARIVNGISYD